MRALTMRPGHPGDPELEEIPEPDPADGPVLVRTLAVGVCGTDRELLAGDAYGTAPPGEDRLVLGHESPERIDTRAGLRPRTVLVTGAGPVGPLAALLARQKGFAVDVLDLPEDGPKPALVADLGATYHTADPPGADVVIEWTGVAEVVGTAAVALGAADPSWLERLITPRVPLADATSAFHGNDIEVVLEVAA